MKKLTRITATLILSLLLFASCKANKVPDPQKALNFTYEEFMQLQDTDEKDLTDSWGEAKVVNQRRIWPVEQNGETRYLVAWIENGKAVEVHASQKFYITKLDDTYCTFGWKGYNENNNNLAYMPTKDIFGNEIKAEPGDKLIFESNGMVEESYPSHIGDPYSAKADGRLSDEELKQVRSTIVWPEELK